MTNKEILAELKRSYEYLRDIRENGCIDHCNGQMEENISKLDNAISNVEDIYYDFYKTLDKEDLRVKSLEHKVDGDKVYICRCVDGDYEVGEELHCMTCCDLEYYWYEDSDFLDEYEDINGVDNVIYSLCKEKKKIHIILAKETEKSLKTL